MTWPTEQASDDARVSPDMDSSPNGELDLPPTDGLIPEWAKTLRRNFERPALATAPDPAPSKSLDGATEEPRMPVLPQLGHRAEIRRLAVVTLFSMDLSREMIGVGEMIQRLEAMIPGAPEWPDEVFQRVRIYMDHPDTVDGDLRVALHKWTIDRLGAVERAILRIGAAELRFCSDIPPKVTINECIELAKDYCEPASYKFINGVLDAIRRNIGKQDFEVKRSSLPTVRHVRNGTPAEPAPDGSKVDPTPAAGDQPTSS
jgi:N utilization substance protein B